MELQHLRMFVLGLVNNAREKHGLSSVTLGENGAAQKHAIAMLLHNFHGHWGLDGLTPNMRYTLSGGTNYVSENASGYILREGLPYRKRSRGELLTELHEGLMQSSGHRKNILNKWHRTVNLGIACNEYACSLVQNFEGDYVDFSEKPTIYNGNLSFAGRLKRGFTFDGVQIWYDQPPHTLTLSQLDATYSYLVGQEPATFLLPPAPAGSYYSSNALRPTDFSWQAGTDPYFEDPGKPRVISPIRVFKLSTPRLKQVPWTIPETWQVSGGSFEIEVTLLGIINDLGPGVYTVFIWGDNSGEKVPLTNYSIFVD